MAYDLKKKKFHVHKLASGKKSQMAETSETLHLKKQTGRNFSATVLTFLVFL